MDKRPTVLIGSSSEGLAVANALKDLFGDKAQVDVWNANVFARNESFLSSLLNASSLYEFAVLVFTGDDQTSIRNEIHAAARDNVLFEFGLFLGRLGARRAHVLAQDKLRLPTDLAGIHFDRFELHPGNATGKDFDGVASRIVNDILERHANSAEFSQLPSTALAIGYFDNFIAKVCDQLDNFEPLIVKDKQVSYSSFTLNIVLADDLRLVEHANLKSLLRGLEHVKVTSAVNSRFRDYPFYIQALPEDGSTHLELFDIPTTMKSSRRAIQKIFPSEFVGRNDLQLRAEQREIANFERTLRLLFEEMPVWKSHIRYRYLTEFLQK